MPRIWRAPHHHTPHRCKVLRHHMLNPRATRTSPAAHTMHSCGEHCQQTAFFANFRKKTRLLETLSPLIRCSKTFEKRMKASRERCCTVSPVQYDSESRIFLFSARVRVAQRRLRETNAPTNVKNATFWQKTRLLADADRVAQQDVCEQRINRLSSAYRENSERAQKSPTSPDPISHGDKSIVDFCREAVSVDLLCSNGARRNQNHADAE